MLLDAIQFSSWVSVVAVRTVAVKTVAVRTVAVRTVAVRNHIHSGDLQWPG